MKRLLTDFRAEFRSRILDLLWVQWATLGVTGQGRPWEHSVLDPEALLLVSCTIARHEPRLFDEALS